MYEITRQFADPQTVAMMEPEELAGFVLKSLKGRFPPRSRQNFFNRHNLFSEMGPGQAAPGYAGEYGDEAQRAFIEAFVWLENQGLVVPAFGHQAGWFVVSRRGERLADDDSFRAFIVEQRFQKSLLHPTIRDAAWPTFIRGELSAAVFQSMRAVEIAVRDASALPQGRVGTALMRDAFNKANGPLTDMETEESEREALSALFAGAIGSYKNPHSHRNVDITDPAEATEIMFLASHLLRIVDARRG